MGLFSFLNRKNESENAAISMLPVLNPADQSEEEVNSVMTATESESPENKPLTVSYATGCQSISSMDISTRTMRRKDSMIPWSRAT